VTYIDEWPTRFITFFGDMPSAIIAGKVELPWR
jgi:hypothetical protein